MTTASPLPIEEAIAQFQKEDYQSVVSRLTLQQVVDANHAQLFFVYAKSQQALKINPFAVIETCDKGIEAFGDFPALMIIRFYSFIALEQFSEAVESGLAVFGPKCRDIQFLLDLGSLLAGQGHPLANVVQSAAQFQIAHYYYHRGDYVRALQASDQAWQFDANCVEALLLQVKTLLAQGRVETALELMARYVHHEAIAYDLMRLRVLVLQDQNNQALLASAIDEWLCAFPEDPAAQKLSYKHHCSQRSDIQNLELIDAALKRDELDTWWTIQRAQVVKRLSEDVKFLNAVGSQSQVWQRIEVLYEAGLKEHALALAYQQLHRDADVPAFIKLANMAIESGDHSLVYSVFQQHALLLRTFPALVQVYAQVLVWVEGYAAALACVESALGADPGDSNLVLLKAIIALRELTRQPMPVTSEAVNGYAALFEIQRESNVKDAEAVYFLGYIACVEGRFEQALKWLNEARDIGLAGPDVVFNAYWIAYAEYQLGLYEDALSSYERWFEKRIHSSFYIGEHQKLKKHILHEIEGRKTEFAKKTQPLKTPFIQRLVFCGVVLLLNYTLYVTDISNSLVHEQLLRVVGAVMFVAVSAWAVSAWRFEVRSKQLRSQTKGSG